MARLTVLLGILALAALPMGPVTHAQTPAAGTPLNTVVVEDVGVGLLAVDPETGEPRWRVDNRDGVSSAVAAGELVYVTVAPGDGGGTDVHAVPLGAKEPTSLGRVHGRAAVAGVAPAGDRLHLLELPPPDPDGRIGPPTGVRGLPIPGRPPEGGAPVAGRDGGWGLLSPDGTRWYRLRPSRTDGEAPPAPELSAMLFDADGPPTAAGLRLPGLSGYHSLLMAPDGGTLYVVDYAAQAIHVVDTTRLSVVRSIIFGQERFKRPLCAAALSSGGDRLYVLGNAGNRGDGILAYDTASWRRVGHLLSGRDFYCLAVSPDGSRLYASSGTTLEGPAPPTDPLLATVDARTGREEPSVPLGLGDCCAWLVAATGTAEAGS